jgi:Ca-activated chloride channel family protein
MRRTLAILGLFVVSAAPASAAGLLVPIEKAVPPLAMLNHHVEVSIDDQVAVTRVEQTFRNHTDRQLEATYLFPVPKGASVREFTMWVGGTKVKGELVEADKARQIYQSIVQRTQDPGLLEYMGNNLLRMKVFPILPKSDQKVAVSFTAVAPAEQGLVEYTYPLKTDARATATLEKFAVKVAIKSQHPLQNIYSPTHAIAVTRANDRQATILFEKDQAQLDRDFQLYYAAGGKDVGLTALAHRPVAGKAGYFLMLISPRAELSKSQQVPRDMVFVLDTSGSMRGKRMEQARNALKYCLKNLHRQDRFGLMNFATTVNKYHEQLLPAGSDELAQARKWVDALEATGGTAINDALAAALEMRSSDTTRTFTIVFFTDGRPTIGETDSEKILKNVAAKNTTNTRIFTFGVGDDVNATMLDALAEQSRALATYVRETEDIESKVSGLYAKISNPVLTNLKLAVTGDLKLSEVYPPQLPDLFHGTQLVVLGRFAGKGHTAVKLTGNVGKETREFVYETAFPDKTGEDKSFVEDLWARRKVGYLLDEIRRNGQKKELVEEVVTLAKRYGIATPYTSYLIVPDAAVPVASAGRAARAGEGRPNVAFRLGGGGGAGNGPRGGFVPPGLAPASGATNAPAKKVTDFLKEAGKGEPGGDGKDSSKLGSVRGKLESERLEKTTAPRPTSADPSSRPVAPESPDTKAEVAALREAKNQLKTLDEARKSLLLSRLEDVQAGQLGVNLSVQGDKLRRQSRLTPSAVRRIGEHVCLEVGGVWIDEGFKAKMATITVKAMSKAYFRILEKHPEVRDVFRLGNHLVWVTPSNTALVIDTSDGREDMSDADIDRLFTSKK